MAERIDFSWNAGPNTDYYQLYEDDLMVVDNILQPSFSLLMTNIAQGTHNYQVRGVNQFGEGPLSDPVTINFILPVRVTGLVYTIA